MRKQDEAAQHDSRQISGIIISFWGSFFIISAVSQRKKVTSALFSCFRANNLPCFPQNKLIIKRLPAKNQLMGVKFFFKIFFFNRTHSLDHWKKKAQNLKISQIVFFIFSYFPRYLSNCSELLKNI